MSERTVSLWFELQELQDRTTCSGSTSLLMLRQSGWTEKHCCMNAPLLKMGDTLRCETRQGQKGEYADRIRDHTRKEEHSIIVFRRAMWKPRALLFVDKLIRQDKDRDRESHDSAGPRPCINPAQQEIRGEKPAEKEKQRRDEKADYLSKASMPYVAVDGAMRIRIRLHAHAPTAVSTG